MKTKVKKPIVFDTSSIVELNDRQITEIVGGTSPILEEVIEFISDCFSITDRFKH